MSIEKNYKSIYFHSHLNGEYDDSLTKAIKTFLNSNEAVLFYRSSRQPAAQEKVVKLDEKIVGTGFHITQLTIFSQKDYEKNFHPCFYFDKEGFCLFHGTENRFGSIGGLIEFIRENFLKGQSVYSLVNFVEKTSDENIKLLSTKELEPVVCFINEHALLDETEIQEKYFPTKFVNQKEKKKEQITVGKILKITPINELKSYLMKTEYLFALIGHEELMALKDHQFGKEKVAQEISASTDSTTTTTAAASSYASVLTAKEQGEKRKAEERAEGEEPAKFLKLD